MSEMPKWVEKESMLCDCSGCDYAIKMHDAISIAWAALANGLRHMKFKGPHSHDKFDVDVFEKAMRRITELGDGK